MVLDDDDNPPGSFVLQFIRGFIFTVFVLVLTCLGVAASWLIVLMCRSLLG